MTLVDGVREVLLRPVPIVRRVPRLAALGVAVAKENSSKSSQGSGVRWGDQASDDRVEGQGKAPIDGGTIIDP